MKINDVVFSGFNIQSYPQGTELAVYSSDVLFKVEKEAKEPEFQNIHAYTFSKI